MKVYVDLVLFLNFAFDFILLLSVSLILRRNIKMDRLLIGAFIGSITVLFLFFNINSFTLFLFKIIVSILMLLATFGFKNIKYFIKNFIFMYLSSIILGGFLYFLNIQFSYKQEGLVFFYNGLSINVIFLIIASPLIISLYIKESKNLRNNYNNYYLISIYYKDNISKMNSYLDTGNKLVDPYKRKPIILVNKNKFNFDTEKFIYVPYKAIKNGILKCVRVDKVDIEGIGIRKNVLIGLMDEIMIEDVDCILNTKLLEGK